MSVINVNKNNFPSFEASEKIVLLDFYADWCGPCRMVSPVIDEIADERADILVGKVNVDIESELAERFEVFSIPTIVVMRNGEIIEKSVGARPKQAILEMLDS